MGSITKTDGRYRVDDIFYLIGKISFFPVCLFGIWFAVNGYENYGGLFECTFRKMSGLPCPGCGGTRAFFHFFRGEFWESIRLNPAVVCGVAEYFHFMALSFYKKHRGKGREKEIPIQIYLYIMLAVLLIQWIVKLVLLVRGELR